MVPARFSENTDREKYPEVKGVGQDRAHRAQGATLYHSTCGGLMDGTAAKISQQISHRFIGGSVPKPASQAFWNSRTQDLGCSYSVCCPPHVQIYVFDSYMILPLFLEYFRVHSGACGSPVGHPGAPPPLPPQPAFPITGYKGSPCSSKRDRWGGASHSFLGTTCGSWVGVIRKWATLHRVCMYHEPCGIPSVTLWMALFRVCFLPPKLPSPMGEHISLSPFLSPHSPKHLSPVLCVFPSSFCVKPPSVGQELAASPYNLPYL